MIMIIHRTMRDQNRCRRKYGEAWKRYEREVPYLFIPVSLRKYFIHQIDADNRQVHNLSVLDGVFQAHRGCCTTIAHRTVN